MDTVDEGLPLQFPAHIFSNTFVCQQHELLYKLVRCAEFAEEYSEGNSLFTEVELDLEPLEGK